MIAYTYDVFNMFWCVGYVTFGRYLNMTGRPMVVACDWPQVLRHLGGQVFLRDVFQLQRAGRI